MASTDDNIIGLDENIINIDVDTISKTKILSSTNDKNKTNPNDRVDISGKPDNSHDNTSRATDQNDNVGSAQSTDGKPQMTNGQRANDGLSEMDLLMATTLVNDAVENRNMEFKPEEKYIRSYVMYKHRVLRITLTLCIWANLLLAIFEKPAVPGVEMPYWATMLLELTFLSYFLFRLLHNSYFRPLMEFWRDPKNFLVLGTIVLTLVDMVSYVVWVNVDVSGPQNAVRWSRPLRVVFLINFPENRQLRKAFRNIRKTLPDIFHVLVLFLSSIAIFSLLILKLMERRANEDILRGLSYPNGTEYFTNYWESFWDLYVLVTTANSPDVMMPAYDQSNWFALFFILYMIINIYIFMNIVLAVIYSNYKKHLKNEVKLSVFLKRRLLSQCFLLLRQQAGAIFVITSARWKALMSALRPEMSSVQMELLQYVLDESGTGNIEKRHFLKVADLLQVELTAVTDSPTWLETTFPRMYNSQPSQLICTAVRSRYFTWFFDLLIFINAIFIGLSIEEAEYFFLPAFSLEVALKIYALGPRRFFKSAWNTFDFTIVTAALLVTIIESIIGQYETRSIVLDILMVLRVLRLIRLLGAIER